MTAVGARRCGAMVRAVATGVSQLDRVMFAGMSRRQTNDTRQCLNGQDHR